MTEQHHHHVQQAGATARSPHRDDTIRLEIRAEEQANARAEVTKEMCRGLSAILAMSDAPSETKLELIAAIARRSTSAEKVDEALGLFNVALERLSRGSIGQRRLAVWARAGESLFLRGDLPLRQALTDRALQVVFFVAYHESKDGTIAEVAGKLRTTRQCVRRMMRRTGIYEPWHSGKFGKATAPHLMIAEAVQPLDAPVVAPVLTEEDPPQVAGGPSVST